MKLVQCLKFNARMQALMICMGLDMQDAIKHYCCAYMSRFGSFEIFKTRDRVTGRAGPSVGRIDILHQLLDYVTSTFYPEVRSTYILYIQCCYAVV